MLFSLFSCPRLARHQLRDPDRCVCVCVSERKIFPMGDDDLEFLRASLAVTGLSTATCQGSPFQAGLRDVMRLWHGSLSEGEGERKTDWMESRISCARPADYNRHGFYEAVKLNQLAHTPWKECFCTQPHAFCNFHFHNLNISAL